MTKEDFPLLDDWADEGPEIAAFILVDDLGRVGIQLRDDILGIPMPGYWGIFGGHVEPGETLPQAAIRELHEETGVVATESDLRPFARTFTPRGLRLFVFLLTKPVNGADITLGEGAGFAFITAKQAPEFKRLPSIARVLDHYFEQQNP